MPERRSSESAEPGAGLSLAERVRGLVRADGARPRRRAPRLEPFRRSWLAAAWHARDAVRAGMTLDDFLRSRLARYVAALPVPGALLPVAVSVEDGQIEARPAEAARPPAAADPGDWTAPLVEAEGPAVREEATALEVRLATVDTEVESSRRRADEIARRFSADVAAGLVAAPTEVEATAEQLGRPPVRSALPRNALLAVAGAAAAAETWQIAVPLLAGAGLDASALGEELRRRPGEVVSVLLFALGAAAALFALARGFLAAAAALAAGQGEARRRGWLVAGSAGAAALAALVATAVAALPRPGAGHAAATPALALLLLAVPVGAALVFSAAQRGEEGRAVQEAAALAWDRERALALADRARRVQEIEWAQEERRGLERQREAARRRLRELNARAVSAARIGAEERERERAALARLAQGLVAALELDRYEFVRQATSRGALELMVSRRRKAPEPRPSAFDSAVAAPAVAEVEAGRLAS